MSMSPEPFNPANALAQHLSERVRAAMRTLTTASGPLTGEPPTGGYTPAAVELRAPLDAVIEQEIISDLYADPGLRLWPPPSGSPGAPSTPATAAARTNYPY